MHCGGLLAVGSGSSHPPRMVVARVPGAGRSAKTVAVVGKGICFDSGGISIKPAPRMSEMKFDKSGACAVLGILRAAAMLKVSPRVVGVLACAENLPGGGAYRPGDVVRTYNGKTIEILNTDAEGRVVLSDALAYVIDKYRPDEVIDLATLTGAEVVALGDDTAALVATDDKLAQGLLEASASTGEPLWRMPLTDFHRELVKSDVADVRNSTEIAVAGVLTAAAFLEHFVNKVAWAHLDIAGPAYTNALDPEVAAGVPEHRRDRLWGPRCHAVSRLRRAPLARPPPPPGGPRDHRGHGPLPEEPRQVPASRPDPLTDLRREAGERGDLHPHPRAPPGLTPRPDRASPVEHDGRDPPLGPVHLRPVLRSDGVAFIPVTQEEAVEVRQQVHRRWRRRGPLERWEVIPEGPEGGPFHVDTCDLLPGPLPHRTRVREAHSGPPREVLGEGRPEGGEVPAEELGLGLGAGRSCQWGSHASARTNVASPLRIGPAHTTPRAPARLRSTPRGP